MRRACIVLTLYLGCAMALPSLAAATGCRAAAPITLRVRFAGESARAVLLESTTPGGLRLVDPATKNELWSAGPGAGKTQRISGMDASFGASLAAVHLDADGVHDRVYAGDQAGRLWRLELRAGAPPSAWMRASVLADLGAPGRGFVAAPDITRIETPAAGSWLNIAIGTANTGAQQAEHRFYVLRDALVVAGPAAPLTEADLEPLMPPLGVTGGGAPGYYLRLGSAQVLAQALTLDGHIHFTVAETGRSLLAGCAPGTLPTTAVPLSVTVLRARDGEVALSHNTDRSDQRILRRVLAGAMPANAGVELATAQRQADGRVPCRVDVETLPECSLDTQPRRTWWRREDAD
ncbi:MAG: hypothetical protein ABIQ86_11595 [Steroidobacteraceae bacterium]